MELCMARTKYPLPQPIMSLKMFYDSNEIVIPEVQRDLVWTKSQKQLLIDSIMRDIDIPKLYFRDVQIDGKLKFEVIDGQQRLNAIFGYMKDEFEMPKDADPFNGEDIAGKKFSELTTGTRVAFQSKSLDIVHLVDYTQEEIDETFLRLQNGTPLKAAEKRRAIAGEMRNVVKELAKHPYFTKCCGFKNDHYNFEDVSTKVLKQLMEGDKTPLTAPALAKFYEHNPVISSNDKAPKNVVKAYNFLVKAFKELSSPQLKKYAAMDLAVIVNSLLNTYNLQSYPKEFGRVYLSFLDEKALNAEKSEEEQDPKMVAYSNASRGDSIEYVEYRKNYLRDYILSNMTYLETKDATRLFTQDQRMVIFRKSGGKCQICGCDITEDDFEADHIIPYAQGGPTTIANGQALCSTCNKPKSDT